MKNVWMGLTLWILAALSAGFIGSQFMPGEWYASLVKPSWNPPGSVFGPVWSALYVMMGFSAWLVWREAGFAGAKIPLFLFIFQLILNALWSYLFFGAHQPMIAFMEIVILWIMILLTLLEFWKVNHLAGALLIPYLCWVTFASGLNFKLWQLN